MKKNIKKPGQCDKTDGNKEAPFNIRFTANTPPTKKMRAICEGVRGLKNIIAVSQLARAARGEEHRGRELCAGHR